MMTVGSVLKREIEAYALQFLERNELACAARAGALTHRHMTTYVSGILFQMRTIFQLLERARRVALDRGEVRLAAYYGRKLDEERGHDRWAERDLEALPPRADESGRVVEDGALGVLMAFLAERVERDPALLLAYLLLAEYLTVLVGPALLGAIETNCGIRQNEISVVAKHVELDGEHAADGAKEIDELVAEEKTTAMLEVLARSIILYDAFTGEILSGTRAAA